MQDVYQNCPSFENETFQLRLLKKEDCTDLLNVYSDKKAVSFFNRDNCSGDGFYCTTEKQVSEMIYYWLLEYGKKGFVRWSIVDKSQDEVIGTIELFNRTSSDFFTNCGLLRLDIRSDYETSDKIERILSLIVAPAFDLFHCNIVATKAIPQAAERISALKKSGFLPSENMLIGHDGTLYDSYFVFTK